MNAAIKSSETLFLTTCKGIEVIDINEIVRIEAISNYSKLFFSNGKTLVVAKVLRWFEETLADHRFIRIHRTHLINRSFILKYVNYNGSKVKLYNGEYIDVAKRKKVYFLKCWFAAAA